MKRGVTFFGVTWGRPGFVTYFVPRPATKSRFLGASMKNLL